MQTQTTQTDWKTGIDNLKIAVYGVGNFGYAFLRHLDIYNQGRYQLLAYDYKPERVAYLAANRQHPVLHRDTWLSDDIVFTNDLSELLSDTKMVLLAVPSTATREALINIKRFAKQKVVIINTAKSLDTATGQRLSEVVNEEMGDSEFDYTLLAGGTIASDLFKQQPLGVSLAGENVEALDLVKGVFSSNNLYLYPTTDLLGVEYAAASKNILSILAGIVNGLGFSYGSETHVISRVADQVAEVCCNHLGAKPATFSMGSQCWGNDMWMSCTGNTRNRQFGQLIGSGQSRRLALAKMAAENKLVEGVNTLEALSRVEPLRQIPLIEMMCRLIVDEEISVEQLRSHILGSGLKGDL